MRICVINPFAGTEFFGRDNLEAIASSGTDFDIVNIEDRYPLTNNQWLFFRHSCTSATIDRAVEAERQGYDAVFISCNLDIGLYECRQMCTIPVTATLEAAALTAHMMGRRFSLLSVDDQNGQIQKMILQQYQLAQGLVSVRSFGIDANDLYVEQTPPEETHRTVLGNGQTMRAGGWRRSSHRRLHPGRFRALQRGPRRSGKLDRPHHRWHAPGVQDGRNDGYPGDRGVAAR